MQELFDQLMNGPSGSKLGLATQKTVIRQQKEFLITGTKPLDLRQSLPTQWARTFFMALLASAGVINPVSAEKSRHRTFTAEIQSHEDA